MKSAFKTFSFASLFLTFRITPTLTIRMDITNSELDSFTTAIIARVRVRKELLDRLDEEASVKWENNCSFSEEDDSVRLGGMTYEPVLPGHDENVQGNPVGFPVRSPRLNQCLGRLTRAKMHTQNKVNIYSASEEMERSTPHDLRERQNSDLNRFNFPIHNDLLKSSTSTKLSSQHQSFGTPILVSKPKIVKLIEQFNASNKPASPIKIEKKPQPRALAVFNSNKPENYAPVEKTCVADLKRLFENKTKEELPKPKKVVPELFSTLQQKKHLFEKAIRNESDTQKKVYRGGQRRVLELSPTRSNESDAKRLKSNTEQPKDIAKLSSTNVNDQHHNDSNNYMSICTNSILTSGDVTEKSHPEKRKSSGAPKVSTLSATDSLDRVLKSIDNYSISTSTKSSEFTNTAGGITSSLEFALALKRISTKAELKSDAQSSVEILQSQKKLQLSIAVPKTANTDAENAPPVRTVSFYRREHGAKQLAKISYAASSPAPTNKLKHQLDKEQQRAALR